MLFHQIFFPTALASIKEINFKPVEFTYTRPAFDSRDADRRKKLADVIHWRRRSCDQTVTVASV